MSGLLKMKEDYSWDLSGIEFVVEERVGEPENFIGRKREMEFLYRWYQMIKSRNSSSIAFLGRRKIGKSLMMERLYNIIYSEHDGIIPFYYEFKEGKMSAKEFAIDFISSFYQQVIGYYTGDSELIREAIDKDNNIGLKEVLKYIKNIDIPHQKLMSDKLSGYIKRLQENHDLYFYVKMATGTPDAFANKPGVKENVLQIIDEFQYFNSEVDAGREDIPSKCYMSTAESKVAPLLVTGSLMGVIANDLIKYTPQRFNVMDIPKMDDQETKAMIRNYGKIYGHNLTDNAIDYIATMTNNVPGRIVNLLEPNVHKGKIENIDDVDQALYYEVKRGKIKADWYEYLSLAMDRYNDQNMKLMTYYLCKNEGEYYYPYQLKERLSLDLDEEQIWRELDILYKYDLIDIDRERYGGIFDRTLKHVLMVNFGHVFNLPVEEFLEYFKGENQLTYLQEKIKELELSLEEEQELKGKIKKIEGLLNHEKGKRYEMTVLIKLVRYIINKKGGIVDGIAGTDFEFYLNYCLKTGEDIDIVIEGSDIIIAVECKNYSEENIRKINKKLIDKFIVNYKKLAEGYPDKEIRPLYLSKNGFTDSIKKYLKENGIDYCF